VVYFVTFTVHLPLTAALRLNVIVTTATARGSRLPSPVGVDLHCYHGAAALPAALLQRTVGFHHTACLVPLPCPAQLRLCLQRVVTTCWRCTLRSHRCGSGWIVTLLYNACLAAARYCAPYAYVTLPYSLHCPVVCLTVAAFTACVNVTPACLPVAFTFGSLDYYLSVYSWLGTAHLATLPLFVGLFLVRLLQLPYILDKEVAQLVTFTRSCCPLPCLLPTTLPCLAVADVTLQLPVVMVVIRLPNALPHLTL